MISQVHVKTQPTECSQWQKQDSGISIIDFNFLSMVTKTVVPGMRFIYLAAAQNRRRHSISLLHTGT